MKERPEGILPVRKKGYNLKFVIGGVLVLYNILRDNFGFRTFDDGGNSFDYNLLMNAWTLIAYGLGLWLINSSFGKFKKVK